MLTGLVIIAAVLLGIGNYLILRTAEAVALDGRRGLVRHLLRLTVPALQRQAPATCWPGSPGTPCCCGRSPASP